MKRSIIIRATLCLLIAYFFTVSLQAQDLTVPEIMAEPSIAGMRAEGEKLSPDGSKVVFLWNAEGKMPRDLYLVSTSGGEPKVILRVSDVPVPKPSPTPDKKLDYGLVVKDDFVKDRENQFGNFEWSPDSTKLVFTQGGDLYVLRIRSKDWDAQAEQNVRNSAARLANLVLAVVPEVVEAGYGDREIDGWMIKQAEDLKARSSKSTIDEVLRIAGALIEGFDKGFSRSALPSEILSLKSIGEKLDEFSGASNRFNTARSDYENLDVGRLKRYTKTVKPEVAARFLDNDRILYQQDGNLFVLNTADATTVQLTKEAKPAEFITVGQAVANKAGTMIAYTVSDNSKQKALFVPNYLDEYVQAPTIRRGWSEQKLFVAPADGSRDAPFEIKLPKSEGVGGFRRIVWAADGRSLIVDRGDKDTKRRQLYFVHNAGGKDEQTILVTEETDEKWLAPLSAIVEPNPKDASELLFCSERDGYNHIYLAKLEKNRPEPNPTGVIRQENSSDPGFSSVVKVEQFTKGKFQVEWAKWLDNGNDVIYLTTESGTAVRGFMVTETKDQDNPWDSAVKTPGIPNGMKTSPQMESKGESAFLLYSYSQWNHPDELVFQRICYRCKGDPEETLVRLTRTVPDAFSKRTWNAPKFIDIPSRDGKQIKSKIYLPANFDQKKKYPMVVFVHGAGYLQNVINGWNNYYREFMFNELLTQKGYVVLDIDYRGSAGYGRDWRTDVYDFLGGKDMDDHIDAIDYMIKNYAVNPAKVGVYGGSYGGFMAEMLAFRSSDKIAAAAALRPVADWKNYYASSPGYTAQRLGFPDKNPEAYKRSSPISYADGLKTNLLILHGIVDDNVHVQDSQQLIEKLIRLGKTQYFDVMFYPAESHGFVRPTSWTDEYTRILNFFERHLKN